MNMMDWTDTAKVELAREEACEILSACACMRDHGLLAVAGFLGIEGLPADLALEAWKACQQKLAFEWGIENRDWDKYYEICSEAESLLHSGWIPGGKVR